MYKIKGFIGKVTYAVSANFLILFVSMLTTLIVPKFFGQDVAQYGYLQIYFFYFSYIGIFHFGWIDGIFLKNGGKQYEELNRPLFSSQFWLILLLEIGIASIIVAVSLFLPIDKNLRFILFLFSANLIIFIPRMLLVYYLQTTNRIKEYARITIIGRSIYGISIILIVLFFSHNYKWFLLGDLFGKMIALMVSIYYCKDIVFSKPCSFKIGLYEAKENISIGCKLLFANIASLLIIGIVQWGIQQKWDVAIYGQISFTLSVSNLLLTFISAVALVLYPTLRRMDQDNLPEIYAMLRNVLMLILFGAIIFYYPLRIILSIWLPNYAESMKYMAILFPLCIFSAKMTMLVQTYMNVFRLEKEILRINLLGVLVAVITTFISVFWLSNLTLAMISIVINQTFRCVYAEIRLSKYIKISVQKDIIIEVSLAMIFICVNWLIGGWIGVIMYVLAYLVYVFVKRKDVLTLLELVKNVRKS